MRIIPLWIDAELFKSENEFALELVNQILSNCTKMKHLTKNDLFDSSLTFKNLEQSLEVHTFYLTNFQTSY